MLPNRRRNARMSVTRKCLALTAFIAVLTIPTATATAVSHDVNITDEKAERLADAHDERRWWRQAAINEWNLAIGRNWTAAAAYLAEQEQEQSETRAASSSVRRAAPSGGSTYSGNATGSVNGYACGGDLPPCSVLQRESGGNPTAENPISSASGLWQFVDGTWNGYGGYEHASHAPPEVQNEKARQTWAGGAGCSHWSQTASGC